MTTSTLSAPVESGAELLALAGQRLAVLVDGGGNTSTLDAVMRRLFDPAERTVTTISAFASAL